MKHINIKLYASGFFKYLAGAGRDAGDEAARRELLVEEGVQRAFRLALGHLALHVVGLSHGLKRNINTTRDRVSDFEKKGNVVT